MEIIEKTIKDLAKRYTTLEDVILEKDYIISRCDTIHEERIDKYVVAVETNQVIYIGRKKDVKNYPKVITINVYENDLSMDEFPEYKSFMKC